MLNSYVNSGKKKFVATTLALAITFSPVTSISYNLYESLFLSASATGLDQTMDRLAELDSEINKLKEERNQLKAALYHFRELLEEAEELKSQIADEKDEFKKSVQEIYNKDEDDIEKEKISSANHKIFGFTGMWGVSDPESFSTAVIRVVYKDIDSAIDKQIANCETFEETNELIEKVINEAYTEVDSLVEQNYGSESEIQNKLDENKAQLNKLKEKRNQIIQENGLMAARIEKYKEQKALKEKKSVLEADREYIESQLKEIDNKINEISTQMSTDSVEQETQTEVNDEMDDPEEEYETLDDGLDQTMDRLAKLDSEINKLKEERAELEVALDEFCENLEYVEEIKSQIADAMDEFKQRVQEAYDLENKTDRNQEISSANAEIFFSRCGSGDAEEKTAEEKTYEYINQAINEQITSCETFEEAEELIEKVINEGYTNLDSELKELYGYSSESEIQNKLDENKAQLNKLEEKRNQIRQEALKKKKSVLEADREYIESQLKEIDNKMNEISTQMSTDNVRKI